MDQFSKTVLWQYVGDILPVIFGYQVPVRIFATEIADQPQHRTMDFVLLAMIADEEIFQHFELQSAYDAEVVFRLLSYGVRLIPAEGKLRRVRSYVIWLEKHRTLPPTDLKIVEGKMVWWECQHIDIPSFTKAQLATGGIGLVVFAPLVRAVPLREFEHYARQLYALAAPGERNQLGTLFLAFAAERVKHRQNSATLVARIERMLRKVGFTVDVIDQMITNTPAAKALAQKAHAEGIQAGIQTGIQTGIIEGQRAERLHLIGRVWQTRFGVVLPDAVAQAAKTASAEQLDQVMDALLDPHATPERIDALLGLA